MPPAVTVSQSTGPPGVGSIHRNCVPDALSATDGRSTSKSPAQSSAPPAGETQSDPRKVVSPVGVLVTDPASERITDTRWGLNSAEMVSGVAPTVSVH